jgi:hypothetical protein
VVVSDQPFTVTEDDHFRIMIKRLNCEAIIPSDVTIRNDIHQSFAIEQTSIQEELQNVLGRISFTLDAWTSKNQLPFLGITAHWISENWELKKITLEFHHLKGPHSGENLAKAFFQVLRDYKLLTKVSLFFMFL